MSSKKDKSHKSDNYFMSIAMNLATERNGLTGTPYELTLVIAASPVSSSEEVYAAIDWEEISR